MKLWIDDDTISVNRQAPEGWLWAKTSDEAIEMLRNYWIEDVSFDHDSGDGDDFIRVARWIESMAYEGKIQKLNWSVHSANPVGAKAIVATMKSAERYWERKVKTDNERYIKSRD